MSWKKPLTPQDQVHILNMGSKLSNDIEGKKPFTIKHALKVLNKLGVK